MKISNAVVSQIIDGELMILNIDSGICFSLDDIAASIWELICQGTPIEALCDVLLQMYDTDPDQLRLDIESLTDHLCSIGILEIEESAEHMPPTTPDPVAAASL